MRDSFDDASKKATASLAVARGLRGALGVAVAAAAQRAFQKKPRRVSTYVVYGRGFDVRLACECDCGHAFLLHPAQVSRGTKCPECHGEVK